MSFNDLGSPVWAAPGEDVYWWYTFYDGRGGAGAGPAAPRTRRAGGCLAHHGLAGNPQEGLPTPEAWCLIRPAAWVRPPGPRQAGPGGVRLWARLQGWHVWPAYPQA